LPVNAMLSKDDLTDLKRAKLLLENPGLTAKIAGALGSPLESGMKMLPAKWQGAVNTAAEKAMRAALDTAVRTLNKAPQRTSNDRLHKLAAAASGAAGGAFGLAALAIELPISTTIMLRSIADVARSEGEQISHIDTKLACITVFALGGRSPDDNAAESSYFAARAALATAVSEASKHLAKKGFSDAGAPALLQLISVIAARFGIVVGQKTAAQAIPIIGAAGGALINTLFIGHYQDMARGHFIVRRLEKVYGSEMVEAAYRTL
jgi:EcsC protein family